MIPPRPGEALTDGVVSLLPLTMADATAASEILDLEGIRAMEPGEPVESAFHINALFMRAVTGWHAQPDLNDRIAMMLRFGFSVIELAEPDTLAGVIGFQRSSIGVIVFYWTAPMHRGRGVAPRSLMLATPWALRAFATDHIYLRAANETSAKVARKAGYEEAGELNGKPLFRFPGTDG